MYLNETHNQANRLESTKMLGQRRMKEFGSFFSDQRQSIKANSINQINGIKLCNQYAHEH